jgi:hypothetical protein
MGSEKPFWEKPLILIIIIIIIKLLQGSAKQVSDRRGQRAPNSVFYKGGGNNFGPPPK